MNIFSTWQFNLITYLIFVVLFYQFYKLAVKNTKSDAASTVALQIIGASAALVLIPTNEFKLPDDPMIYGLLLLACVFYALNNRLQTTARKHLHVSSFAIINQLNTVFIIIISLIINSNINAGHKIAGASLILLGNILMLWKSGKIEINKYVIIAVISALCASTAVTIGIWISKYFNLPFYIFLTFIIPAVLITLKEKVAAASIKEELTSASKIYYYLTGILWTLAIFFSLRTFQYGNVETVAPLQATSVFLNVLVAYVLLKERGEIIRKLLASALVGLGVYTQI
jgi:drug/metabolite transporter (DMT)-like permease